MIKVDVDGYGASQVQYSLRHHVNMQFNKIPQLDMHCNEIHGGMILQGIGKEVIGTLEP